MWLDGHHGERGKAAPPVSLCTHHAQGLMQRDRCACGEIWRTNWPPNSTMCWRWGPKPQTTRMGRLQAIQKTLLVTLEVHCSH